MVLASYQAKALREEARLGANVRLALKDQLRAEKKRSNVLEQQVSDCAAGWDLSMSHNAESSVFAHGVSPCDTAFLVNALRRTDSHVAR